MKNALVPGAGGPMGRHASPHGLWFNPLPWLLLLSTITFVVLYLRHVPCVQMDATNPINTFIRVCYSDIQTNFFSRGFGLGGSPVVGQQLVDAPLVSVVMALTLFVMQVWGVTMTPSAAAQEVVDASVGFFSLTVVILFVCFLVLVLVVSRLGPRTPGYATSWDGMVFAASPVVLAVGLIDWTLLPVALTAVGLVHLANRRLFEAGLVLALAASAGTMAMAVVCAAALAIGLRYGIAACGRFLGAAVASFTVVHVPLALSNFDQLYAFYHGEINRDISYGSIWYLLQLMGFDVRGWGSITFGMLMILLLAGAAAVYVTRVRPHAATVIAATVLLTTLLAPTFPPQAGLWVLLATWLGRPYRPELVVISVTQVLYCIAIWGWLGSGLASGQSGPNLLYLLAVLFQVAAQGWVLSEVVADLMRPTRARGIAERPGSEEGVPGEETGESSESGLLVPETALTSEVALSTAAVRPRRAREEA